MINENEKETIIRMFKEKILSPVVYMYGNADMIELVCFFDRHITLNEIYNAERSLIDVTGKNVEISDIRQYSETDRMTILQESQLLYAESNAVKKLFERSVAEDYLMMLIEKEEMIGRYAETSSPYLH